MKTQTDETAILSSLLGQLKLSKWHFRLPVILICLSVASACNYVGTGVQNEKIAYTLANEKMDAQIYKNAREVIKQLKIQFEDINLLFAVHRQKIMVVGSISPEIRSSSVLLALESIEGVESVISHIRVGSVQSRQENIQDSWRGLNYRTSLGETEIPGLANLTERIYVISWRNQFFVQGTVLPSECQILIDKARALASVFRLYLYVDVLVQRDDSQSSDTESNRENNFTPPYLKITEGQCTKYLT